MAGQTLIICVSVSHGSTKAVAQAMAAVLGAEVREPEEVEPRVLGNYDLVGFGSGIYFGSFHRRLRDYVAQLPQSHGTRAFVFSTSGQGHGQHLPWQPSLETMLQGKGYDVVGSFGCRGFDTWLPLQLVGGINKHHPDVRDLTHAHLFAERMMGAPLAG